MISFARIYSILDLHLLDNVKLDLNFNFIIKKVPRLDISIIVRGFRGVFILNKLKFY